MKVKWDSEKELALAVINHLKSKGWTTYPEINGIDIIAEKDDCIIGIECKKHFNLTVMDQAYKNRKVLNQSWIAVSHGHSNNERFGMMVAKQYGIGVIFVSKVVGWYDRESHVWNSGPKYEVHESYTPPTIPRENDSIKELFHPTAENYAEAGQAGGKHWTAFAHTVTKLKEYIGQNPGCKMSQAVAAIKHHYKSNSNAVSSLSHYMRSGVICGIEAKEKQLYLEKV